MQRDKESRQSRQRERERERRKREQRNREPDKSGIRTWNSCAAMSVACARARAPGPRARGRSTTPAMLAARLVRAHQWRLAQRRAATGARAYSPWSWSSAPPGSSRLAFLRAAHGRRDARPNRDSGAEPRDPRATPCRVWTLARAVCDTLLVLLLGPRRVGGRPPSPVPVGSHRYVYSSRL